MIFLEKDIILILIILLVSSFSFAQDERSQVYDSVNGYSNYSVIMLNDVVVIPEKTFKNKRERAKHLRLTRDFLRTYPYALIIKEQCDDLAAEIECFDKRRDKRSYINAKEDTLKAEFQDKLMKLTTRQGFLLVKLVNRETEETAYDIVKEMKGGLAAVFWQGIAKLFKNDLKAEYDSEDIDEDIERLIKLYEIGYFDAYYMKKQSLVKFLVKKQQGIN